MMIRKAYKIKLRPTEVQKTRLLEIADCTRFVWNYYLALKKDIYIAGGKPPNYFGCTKDLTDLKRQEGMEWLKEKSIVHPLQQTLRDQENAYKKFFTKKSGFPNFKSKHDVRRAFRIPTGWKLKGNKLQLTKDVKVRFGGTTPPMKSCLKSVSISRDSCGTWWASILTEQEIKPKKKTGDSIGIDLGLKHLLTISDGRKIENIHPRKKVEQQIKTLSRSLSRTKCCSARRTRSRSLLARLHRKIAFRRSSYIHSITRKLADENQAVIYAEDLAVKNMQANHCLASSITDASWSELLRQLEYKQVWSGGTFIKIDRFFPSSKTCSHCHFILARLPLSVRDWECPKCHSHHDRDVNAAKNILNQGAGCQLHAERITEDRTEACLRSKATTSLKR